MNFCRQVAGECGEADFTPYNRTMEFRAGDVPVTENRVQMDMYICAPFGEYELEIQVRSTNGKDDDPTMEKVAWEVEFGPDEVRSLPFNIDFWQIEYKIKRIRT